MPEADGCILALAGRDRGDATRIGRRVLYPGGCVATSPEGAHARKEADAGDIHIAAEGLGPDDGFTGYRAQVFPNPIRPRWGDYGSASVDGNTIWIASEYIGQTCTLAQYLTPPLGTCGGTRGALGNGDTRISQVTP